jgi:hypothetical protein
MRSFFCYFVRPEAGKFIQFSTMFVNHYHSQSFMKCVCSSTTFGEIQAVDTILMINQQDLKQHLNITYPLTAGQGCVRRLARYALLITTLMLKSNKNKPTRAMVVNSDTDKKSGQPITANCIIEFSGGVTLRCRGTGKALPLIIVVFASGTTLKTDSIVHFCFYLS